jgi:hypothetical protein
MDPLEKLWGDVDCLGLWTALMNAVMNLLVL